MTVVRDFEGWPSGPIHIAIGVFDGVHRGHQELVRRLSAGARADGASAIAATFDPLPTQVLSPGSPPSALSDAAERAELLARAGADAVVIFRYDAAFAAMSAREFVDRVRRAGDVRHVVVGPDFRFGRGREGDVALLVELGRTYGYAVEVVAPVEIGGTVASSTRIRELLRAGDVERAAELLGRPYAVRGRIARRSRQGPRMDPAIGVTIPAARLLPHEGIYATWVTVDGTRLAGATTVGGVPPAGSPREDRIGSQDRALETRLIDDPAAGDDAEIAFVRRARDLDQARAILRAR